jgi:hypothetical protein
MQVDAWRPGPIQKISTSHDFDAGFVHHADKFNILFVNIQSLPFSEAC